MKEVDTDRRTTKAEAFRIRSGDGSLICYNSLNYPITDARYSGQLSESCSLFA